MTTRLTTGMLLISLPLLCMGAVDKTREWIEILQSDAPIFAKARACQQLGESGTEAAVPALASLLDHPRLSTYARTGLERIPGPASSAALRKALGQTQGTLRIGVIDSLAALRDARAVPALTELTHDSDGEAARAALLALGRIATEQAVTQVRQALQSGPARLRPDAAAACLLAAETLLQQDRTETARAIYDAVRQAQVPLSYRIGATRGAIIARRSDRIAFLVQQLHSKVPALRDVALLTIREIPSDALAAALNTELEQAPRDLQLQLIMALKDCHNAQSLRLVSAYTEAADPELRLTALKVLKGIGVSESTATFLKVLSEDRSQEEVSIAMSSLELMDGPEVDALILKALQSSPVSDTRVQLIQLLGIRQVAQAKGELVQQAAGPASQVSIAAYQALKSLADLEDLPRLIALTKACRDETVRDVALGTIYSVSKQSDHVDDAGAMLLRELRAATVTTEKLGWIRVLALLGYAQALPAITGSLRDSDEVLAQGTVTQLGRWPDPAPVKDLFQVVEGQASPDMRRRALMAVLQLAIRAADRHQASDETLLAWFRRARPAARSVPERRLLISGLGRVHRIGSVQLLALYLDDPAVKIEAVHGIVSAAAPLTRGSDYRAVEAVLQQISDVKEPRLLDQIHKLEQEIQATRARLGQ